MRPQHAVPVPPEMQHLACDKRGYPIPFIVATDNAGEPLFTINDSGITEVQAAEGLCGICGRKIEMGEFHFIGGPASAFHPFGAYVDGPVHHACGTYALRVCPYLAAPKYSGRVDERPALKNGVSFDILKDPTMLPDRPEVFVMIRTMSYALTLGHPGERKFRPVGEALSPPESAAQRMLTFEVWRQGKPIRDEDEAMNLIREGVMAATSQTPQKPRIIPVQRVASGNGEIDI